MMARAHWQQLRRRGRGRSSHPSQLITKEIDVMGTWTPQPAGTTYANVAVYASHSSGTHVSVRVLGPDSEDYAATAAGKAAAEALADVLDAHPDFSDVGAIWTYIASDGEVYAP